EHSLRRPGVVQRQDVRVLEMRGEPDFLQEPLCADHRRDFRADHLDRDLAVMFAVACKVHGGHAAPPELPLEGVAIGQGGAQAVQRCDHSATILGVRWLARKLGVSLLLACTTDDGAFTGWVSTDVASWLLQPIARGPFSTRT